MGIFSGLVSLAGSAISAVGSIFGGGGSSLSHNSSSTSNTQTMYEPDKVKVAELENNRMDKAIVAQKDIKLPSDLKNAVKQAMKEATALERKLSGELNDSQFEKIKEYAKKTGKLKIHYLTQEQISAWREAVSKIYPQFYSNKKIGKDLIEATINTK